MENSRQQFLEAQQRTLHRYGVVADSQFVEVAAVEGRAHVLTYGDGPPVLMLNGIGTPGAMWAPLMATLRGFRLFVVDLPGFGLTDAVSGFTSRLRGNVVRFLDDVLQVLNLERAHFIGNSLGSLCTSWLALDRPERVRSIVHVGCPAVVLDSSAPLPMRLLSNPFLGRLMMRIKPPSSQQVEELSKMVHEYPLPAEVAELLLATEQLPEFRRIFLGTLHALIRLRGSRPSKRLTADQLARINQPTLIVWGRKDPFGGIEVGERMAEVMPRAELHIVDAGHGPWLTQSETIGPIASRFLLQHS